MKKKRLKKSNLSFNKSHLKRTLALFAFILLVFLTLAFIFPGFLKTHGSSTISFMQDSWDGGTIGGNNIVQVGAVGSWNRYLSSNSLDLDQNGKLQLAETIEQWAGTGYDISNDSSNVDENPVIYPDNIAGKYFIIWESHNIANTNRNIKILKVNSDGSIDATWNSGNVFSVIPSGTYGNSFSAVSDGNGGIIVAWEDNRDSGYGSDTDIYVKKLDSSGNVWTGGDRVVSIASDKQVNPQVVGDGAGGAIISWKDFADMTVRSQRINESCDLAYTGGMNLDPGQYMCWDADYDGQGNYLGIEITGVGFKSNDDVVPMIPDGSGGAIITWTDANETITHPGDPYNIYAQRINDSCGADPRCWNLAPRGLGGVKVSSLTTNQISPRLTTDGSGGAIIFWEGVSGIYAQKVNISCVASDYQCWNSAGVLVSSHHPYLSANNFKVTDDTFGGAAIVWQETNGTDMDIYAQRVDFTGVVQWVANGLPIVTADGDQENAAINRDSTGNFYFVWSDKRTDKALSSSPTVFAQNVSSAGAIEYKSNGIELNFAKLSAEESPYVSYVGGSGNVIVVYADDPSISPYDIYIQKIGAQDFFPTGSLTSSVYDFGQAMNWNPFIIDADIPDITSNITFKTRTADDGSAINSAVWSADTLVDSPGSFPILSPAGRYIQYQLTFTKGSTPTLNSVTISGNPPSSIPPPTYTIQKPEQASEEVPAADHTPNPSPEENNVAQQPAVCSNTLAEIQATPLPNFDSIWGTTYAPTFDRVKWAYDHRANIYYEYVNLLGRQPCATEVNWWLQNDPNIFSIRYKILTSPEYLSKHPINK